MPSPILVSKGTVSQNTRIFSNIYVYIFIWIVETSDTLCKIQWAFDTCNTLHLKLSNNHFYISSTLMF